MHVEKKMIQRKLTRKLCIHTLPQWWVRLSRNYRSPIACISENDFQKMLTNETMAISNGQRTIIFRLNGTTGNFCTSKPKPISEMTSHPLLMSLSWNRNPFWTLGRSKRFTQGGGFFYPHWPSQFRQMDKSIIRWRILIATIEQTLQWTSQTYCTSGLPLRWEEKPPFMTSRDIYNVTRILNSISASE